MGYGIQAGEFIPNQTIIFEVPYMSCISAKRFLDLKIPGIADLLSKCNDIAKQFARDNYGLHNKLYQTMMGAHLHVVLNYMGKESSYTPYYNALPKFDLTSLFYWQQDVLAEVDSKALMEEYTRGTNFYTHIGKQFVDYEFTKYNLNEWLWAFYIMSKHYLIFLQNFILFLLQKMKNFL